MKKFAQIKKGLNAAKKNIKRQLKIESKKRMPGMLYFLRGNNEVVYIGTANPIRSLGEIVFSGKKRIRRGVSQEEPSLFVTRTKQPETAKFDELLMNENQTTRERKQNSLILVTGVIEKLRAQGIKKIITAPTIIPPRAAAKVGFRLVRKIQKRGLTLYQYAMDLK